MSKKIFFSIIVPCYNVETYVDNCIEKIRMQSFTDYRVIFINDGSLDHTLTKLEIIREKFDNIIVLQSNNKGVIDVIKNLDDVATYEYSQNCGLSCTRNCGLSYVQRFPMSDQGDFDEWVIFLDCDDYLLSDSLERLNEVIQNEKCIDFILTDFNYIYEDDKEKKETISVDLKEGVNVARNLGEGFGTIIQWPWLSCVGTKIYNLKFISENGLRFDDNKYKYNEDAGFALNAFFCARNVYYLKYPCYQYLQRKGSIMYSYRPQYYTYLRRVLDLYEKYLLSVNAERRIIHEKRMQVVLESLLNEIRFQKDAEYDRTFNIIVNDIKVLQSANYIITDKCSSLKFRIFAVLIRFNFRKIIRKYLSGRL